MHGGAGVARCGRLASLNLPYHEGHNVGTKGTEGVLFGVRRLFIRCPLRPLRLSPSPLR
jgi:hypothetical protein